MVKKMDVERFNLKKLKEQYQVTIKNKFAALKTLRIMGTSVGHGTLLETT
jgi:hypothetical protein